MFKPLLIHNDNTPLKDICSNSLTFKIDSFDLSSSDIDTYISQKILPLIKDDDFNILFIKDNLSKNYIELYGILLAYHIRLSSELGESIQKIPIVILSDLDGYILNKISPMAKILFTKNVFIGKNKKSTLEYYRKIYNQISTLEDLKNGFLNQIDVKPPQDYLSHHSITNEWSLYCWAEYMKIHSDEIKKIKESISTMLYFKFLKSKYPIPKTTGIRFAPKVKEQGKILYIDDEWQKGWKSIFDHFFSELTFKCVEKKFKDKSIDSIIDFSVKEIKIFKPDLILLDLHLLEKDIGEKNYENISGIKLLNIIKKINPGIQIVVFTASQDSLKIEKIFQKGILGYIKKEGLNNYTLKTKDNIKKLSQLVEKGLKNKYLKDVWSIQQEIIKLDMPNEDEYNEIKLQINNIFDILNSELENKFNYVVFSFTKVLEIISVLHINEYNMMYIDNQEKVGVYDIENNRINRYTDEKYYKNIQNRLHNIMFKKLEITDKSSHQKLCELINCRNYLVHPKERSPKGCNMVQKPDDKNILSWFKILETILKKAFS